MKKSIKQKIVNPEAIYDCKIIGETSKVFLNFIKIIKKEKLITSNNFLYCLEQLEIFEYNCATFNNMFFGDKIPNISNISINKKHINENINEKKIIDKKLNILIKYSENKNFKKFKKISIEILDYLKMIYNNKIGNILDELQNEERYEIVPLSNIFILISELKMMIQ
jgi:hypothetical protein